ncbi:MAG: PAS domain S-box protein [Thaumarchaeota archaeon]|nr:PAS domain S-box protein [Nitrososphaerota archaeon]
MLSKAVNRINNIIGGGLTRRFVFWILAIILLLGILTNIVVQTNLTQTLSDELKDRGEIISKNLAASSVEPVLVDDMVTLHRLVDKIKATEDNVRYIYITDGKGRVLAHTFDTGFPVGLLDIYRNFEGDSRLIDTGEDRVIDFRAPILEGNAGFVHIGLDERIITEKVSETSNLIIILVLIVGSVGVFLAYMAGNYLTTPLRAVVKGTEEVGRGNLGYRIEVDTTDEISHLANAFNQMSRNLGSNIEDLRTSEERYKRLVDGISDAVILIDTKRTILSWNSAAAKMFGYNFEEMVGKDTSILFHSSTDGCRCQDDEMLDGESLFVKRGGSTFSGVVHCKPLKVDDEDGHVLVIRDVSEQKEKEKLEKQLLQADKLATLGTLAAGVAHEINNPLANISLYSEMAMKRTSDGKLSEKLKVINEEANRAALIAKGLLDFAHQPEIKSVPTDVNEEVKKVLSILGPELKGIDVITDLGAIPRISADSGQIQQVFMNLLTNSIQAVGENGVIRVKTVVKQGSVEVRFSDNGCGIPPENLGKVFDPFFTTKSPGKGTGLGLSICYGIVQRHNGSIDVESEVDVGTTFTVRLPI